MTTSIFPGNLLFEEKPFAVAVTEQFISLRCDECLSLKPLKTCIRCHTVKYCSKECQEASWPVHKKECHRRTKKWFENYSSHGRLLAKVIIKVSHDSNQVYYAKDKFKTIFDLDYTLPTADTCKKTLLKQVGTLIGFQIISSPGINAIVHKVLWNYTCIEDYGLALHIFTSTLKKTCSPNVMVVYNGLNAEIRAIKNIPNFKWSKVESPARMLFEGMFENYSSHVCGVCSGVGKLEQQYGIVCPNPTCGKLVFLDNTFSSPQTLERMCRHCGREVPNNIVSRYRNICQYTLKSLKAEMSEDTKSPTLDEWKTCLNMQDSLGLFHTHHILRLRTLLNIMGGMDQLNDAEIEMYSNCLFDGLKKHWGNFHPKIVELMFNIGREMYLRHHNHKAAKVFKKIADIQLAMAKNL